MVTASFLISILMSQPTLTRLMPLGVRDAFSPHAVLELISVSVGEVRIRSVETGLYLSMGSDGKVSWDVRVKAKRNGPLGTGNL